MEYHRIITHEHPDLDAMMSVLLMKTYGESRFPGISGAEIGFCSANKLPEEKTPQQFEREGVLLLDIGGGKFDTHPVDNRKNETKRENCATDLVAAYLGMIDDPAWKQLIEYTRLQDTTGHSLYSKEYYHHMISIHTILLGLELESPDSATMLRNGQDLLLCISEYLRTSGAEFDDNALLQNLFERYLAGGGDLGGTADETEKTLAQWYAMFTQEPARAFSDNPMDAMVSIRAIIRGAHFRYPDTPEQVYTVFQTCVRAILKREEQWRLAIEEFRTKAVVTPVNRLKICCIEAENRLTIKASRFLVKSDLLIFRNAFDKATTITLNRNGILAKFDLSRLAGFIRVIESYHAGEAPDYTRITEVGDVNGWFLHQSMQMLIKGSSKATDFIPSKISMEDLNLLVCFYIDNRKEKEYTLPPHYQQLYLEYSNPLFRRQKR